MAAGVPGLLTTRTFLTARGAPALRYPIHHMFQTSPVLLYIDECVRIEMSWLAFAAMRLISPETLCGTETLLCG